MKDASEVRRSDKLGRKHYCCRAHIGEVMKGNLVVGGDKFDVSTTCDNRRDMYTGFREFIRRSKQKQKGEVTVTVEYLKDVWDKQQGICPYAKIELRLPTYKKKGNSRIYTASLDRIDSSKGYVPGNVQFISMALNYMKSDMTHEEVMQLINIIKQSN